MIARTPILFNLSLIKHLLSDFRCRSESPQRFDSHCSSVSCQRSHSHSGSSSRRKSTPPSPQLNTSVSKNANHSETSHQLEKIKEKNVSQEITLDATVLIVFGKRLYAGRVLAPQIHNDFAVCWKEIIKLDLPEKDFKDLLKKISTFK